MIESAIKQIQEENILSIGHYPKDGVFKDTALDVRSNSRMSSGTYTLASSDTNFSGLESLRSRSRSKSPGVFSKSTLATRQKQRESVDYRFGQYAFSPDLPPAPAPQPRPEPDWVRRHSTAGSQDSRISETRSFGSSETSEKANRRSSFKKSATKLSGYVKSKTNTTLVQIFHLSDLSLSGWMKTRRAPSRREATNYRFSLLTKPRLILSSRSEKFSIYFPLIIIIRSGSNR